jgi:hypothetical protein
MYRDEMRQLYMSESFSNYEETENYIGKYHLLIGEFTGITPQ